MNFDEYVQIWKRDARFAVSRGWQICQDSILKLHISPYIGSLEITKITPSNISAVIHASVTRGHSPNQTKKIYMVMSKIFKDCLEFHELILRSPVKKRFHLPKVPVIERPFMTPLQSWALLEFVMNDDRYGVAVWLQLLSGLRISEVQGLQWQDVLWDENKIYLRRIWNRTIKEFQPYTKNKTQYKVPMPPALKKYLETKKKSKGFVCTNAAGEMFGREGYKGFLKNVSFKLKLPIKSSHGLRHSCSALYADLGASDECLQSLLGHKSHQSLKSYKHRDDKNLSEIAKKLA